MTIEQLFTTYWSQLTLILLGIGYFIKRVLDNISKKSEINHSLFQQKRLESVNSFFTIYAKTERMWVHIRIHEIVQNKISPTELDEIIFPLINELKRNLLELQIYFNDEEYSRFKNIYDNIILINRKLSDVYFDFDQNKTNTEKSNSFQFYREDLLEKNEVILKHITLNLKKTFK